MMMIRYTMQKLCLTYQMDGLYGSTLYASPALLSTTSTDASATTSPQSCANANGLPSLTEIAETMKSHSLPNCAIRF